MVKIDKTRRYGRQRKYFDYNQFFHPNVCHVCKSTDLSNLTLCARCNMIAYCSEEHRKKHHPQHKEICSMIAIFMDNYSEWNTRSLRISEWIESQANFMQTIRMMLTRKMKPYEEQMFMYANSCYMCHRRSNLYTCEQCCSFSYCANHASISSIVHNPTICKLLLLTLKLDIKSLDPFVWKIIHIKFTTFPSKKKRFTNMKSFCNRYFQPQRGDQHWCLYDHIFTNCVSEPLTLYTGLQTTRLFRPETETNIFNIHIIAANHINKQHFPVWELFLHLLTKSKKLIITMIGPELQYKIIRHNVCSLCKMAKKKLVFKFFPLLYHDYIVSDDYSQPDVIVGFQAELGAQFYEKTWSQSIKAIQTQNCPLLLTAQSLDKAQKDINKIQKVLGTSVKPVLETKNKFSSYRPYRDFETGLIMYRNTYMIVYKNLNNSNDSNDVN